MAAFARKRLLGDLLRMHSEAEDGVTAAPRDDKLFIWDAYIFGPPGTPWHGGIFQLTMRFSEKYPIEAPNVEFVSDVFHVNVFESGRICLDILTISQWSAAYDITGVLRSIQSLLTDPNPESAANGAAVTLYKKDREMYDQRVRECAKESIKLARESLTTFNSHAPKLVV